MAGVNKEGTSIALVSSYDVWDARVMFSTLGISPEKRELPDGFRPLTITVGEDRDPEVIIDTLQTNLGYCFKRPGLLLAAVGNTRFFEDPSERGPLLNFLGRVALSTAAVEIATAQGSLFSRQQVTDIERDVGTQLRIGRIAKAISMKRFVDPERSDGPHPGIRFSNADQAVFNCLGAMLLDSGSMIPVKDFMLAHSKLFFETDFTQASCILPAVKHAHSLGAEARLNFESLVGYTFKNSGWLDMAMNSMQVSASLFRGDTALLSRGCAVTSLVISDLLRQALFDRVTAELREENYRLISCEEMWRSQQGTKIARAVGSLAGWSEEEQDARSRKILWSLVGAVYSDGGYGPVVQFVRSCLPALEARIAAAQSKKLTSADLNQMQVQMDLEGELQERRLALFNRRTLQSTSMQQRAANATPSPQPLGQARSTSKAELLLLAQTEELGAIKYNAAERVIDGEKVIEVTVSVGGKVCGVGADKERKLAEQLAAKGAIAYFIER